MYMHVCDLCKKKSPDAKIKYKYKAKKFFWCPVDSYGWVRIELCNECLENIIAAKGKAKSEDKE